MIKVSPSILAADFANLERDIHTAESADYLHVDVMDGLFVPNISIGVPVVKSLRKATKGFLDVHLMISQPEKYIDAFMKAGADLVGDMKKRGYQLIVTGEMGIGNTTASTAMACALLGCEAKELTGRGAGLSNAGLMRKQAAIERALKVNSPDPSDPVDVIAKVGGFEIAQMAGAFLGGMEHRVPVVIDGVISAVAALTAARLNPEAKNFMLPSHMSREPAMTRVMAELGLEPVIHADMALGEGTGAAALLPLLDMALRVYHGPHTFADLGMDAYVPQEDNT